MAIMLQKIFNDALGELIRKRPGCSEEHPFDLEYDEDFGDFVVHKFYGLDLSGVETLRWLMTRSEIEAFVNHSISDPVENLYAWVKTLPSKGTVVGAADTDIGDNDLTDTAEKNSHDNLRTLLQTVLFASGLPYADATAILNILAAGEVKKLADLGRIFTDFGSTLLFAKKASDKLILSDEATVDEARVIQLKSVPIAKLKERCVSETADITLVPGHRLVGKLLSIGYVKCCKGVYTFRGRVIKTGRFHEILDPLVGEFLATELSLATGTSYKYSHTSETDLTLGFAMACLAKYTHTNTAHEFNLHERDATKGDCIDYLDAVRKKKLGILWEAFTPVLNEFVALVTTLNKHPLVWVTAGTGHFDYLIEQVKFVMGTHPALAAKGEAALVIAVRQFDRAVELHGAAVAKLMEALIINGTVLCQSTHYPEHGVLGVDRIGLVNQQMMFVTANFPLTVVGERVIEVTNALLWKLDPSGIVAAADKECPWKVAGTKAKTATPITDLNPGSLNQALSTSRRFPRASEGDKYGDEIDNMKQLGSGLIDTEVDFAYSTSTGVSNDFALALEEFNRHGRLEMAIFLDRLKNGVDGGPGVIAYDVNREFLLRNQILGMFPSLTPSEVDNNVHVFCKSANAKDFANPVTSRITYEPKDMPAGSGRGRTLICAFNWEQVQNTATGYDKEAPQQQVIQTAIQAGFDQIVFKAKMTDEHDYRMNLQAKVCLSGVMELLVNSFNMVSFIPCSRLHNGTFWVVATQGFTDKAALKPAAKRISVANWRAFSVLYAIAMKWANVLKDTASIWSVYGPRVVMPTLLNALYGKRGHTSPDKVLPWSGALSSINFISRKSNIVGVPKSKTIAGDVAVTDEEGEVAAADGDVLFPDYIVEGDSTIGDAVDLADRGVHLLPSVSPALSVANVPPPPRL